MDNEPQKLQTPQYPEQQHSYPAQPGVIYSQNSAPSQSKSKLQSLLKNRKVLVIGGAALGLLVLLIIVLVAAGGDKKQVTQNQDANQSSQNDFLSPAKAVDVEQTNNSISQDLSSISDDKQLPATRLDDKTLGL